MESIGLIGVGAMGTAMIEQLQRGGVSPTVYDVFAPAVEGAAALGAVPAASPAAVAASADIVAVMVRTDEDMLDAVLGPDGALQGLSAGKVLVLHSTILPETTQAITRAAQERGVHVSDACIVGVPAAVRAGEAYSLVGADPAILERIRPYLLLMVKQVFHMGPVGAGNVAKIIKNLVTGSERLVIAEALRIGEAGGIPYVQSLEMMRQVHSHAQIESWETAFDPSGASVVPFPGANVISKDLPLALELADALGVDVPITRELVAAGEKVLEVHKPAAVS